MTSENQLQTIRIFIVEDYPVTRLALVAALSKYTRLQFVGESESAEDALEHLDTQAVDILLLDLGLPDMNGIEMAQIVRQRWPEIKIIILTSHNQPEEVVAALGAGAQAYALKDIKPHYLAQVIESVYEGGASLDPALATVILDTLVFPGHSSASKSNAGVQSQAYQDLTEDECEVLKLLAQGCSNQAISDKLHINLNVTTIHIRNILGKLSLNDSVQAAVKAINDNPV